MSEADLRIRRLLPRLSRLAEALDAAEFDDLLGSVEVEIEAGEETLMERELSRRPAAEAVIVPFPSRGSR